MIIYYTTPIRTLQGELVVSMKKILKKFDKKLVVFTEFEGCSLVLLLLILPLLTKIDPKFLPFAVHFYEVLTQKHLSGVGIVRIGEFTRSLPHTR